MKKLKWYTVGIAKPGRVEKKMRRMVLKLNRFAERHNMPYAELYILESEKTRTVNIRAKKSNGVEMVNSYAFIKG